jgi:hypothetical protein
MRTETNTNMLNATEEKSVALRCYEVVAETIAFYRDSPHLRAADEFTCYYLMPDGRRCALGRCVLDSVAPKLTHSWNGVRMDGVEVPESERDLLLKPEYRGLPMEMWGSLQDWHDQPSNWGSEGLTEHGVIEMEELLAAYPKP